MPQPVEDRVAEGLAHGGTSAILDGCRPEPAAPDGQGGLEQRLRQVVERLERVAGTLDATLDSLAGRPSADAAAEVLAREADHRIRNSLQTVIALLEQQARRAEAETLRDVLRRVGGRRAADGRAPG